MTSTSKKTISITSIYAIIAILTQRYSGLFNFINLSCDVYMYWIINEFIEFRPASKKLISRRNPELNVVLTSPASRCLLLLLEASPDVVPQQELFKKVWEDEGMYVPTNTLYQNISIVRRGLKAVGETEQTLIATIPRKGFKIEQGVKIVRMASEELFPEEEQEEEQTGNAEELLLPVNEHQQPRISLMSRLSLVFIMLLAFIVGATGMHFYWHSGETTPFFADYKLLEQENGCHFYVKDDSHDGDNNFARIKTLITRTGLDCKKYPWIYLPLSKTDPGLAVLVCKKDYLVHSVPGCMTLSFREAYGE